MPTRKQQLSGELRLLLRNAFREPEELETQLPAFLGFFRVPSAGELVSNLDRVHFIRRNVLPDYLGRLPDTGDCRAVRELFTWEDENGAYVPLQTRYARARRHLKGVAMDFGRRQEPRLMERCAQYFLEFDADDRLAARGRDATVPAFWGLESSTGITLVFPEIPPHDRIRHGDLESRDHIRLARFADTDTLLELRSFLARDFPQVAVQDYVCTEVPPEGLVNDLIVVGGIALNDLTEQVLDEIGSPFRQIAAPDGEVDALFDTATGETFEPKYGTHGMVVSDYGLFARAQNPFNAKRRVFVVNGVLTHGVLGASRCFTDARQGALNVSYLQGKHALTEAFAVLVKVSVVLNHVPPPDLSSGDLVKGPVPLAS